ncbi:PTS glucose transporter subunit IIA [Rheinheimera baltica]|uniref:PTS glucose transporter subunit IIA n=1 Tax=Rheinheimera baltica TaxID=67576 RepID=UPI00273EDAB2|nr:PTS glucose transporter subunit IIA [Rheinheimera baltica]MDP5144690.1 PTS glucose transporter subunit IIA [Rheinheimera baltica]
MIQWLPYLDATLGLAIKSPATGQIKPVTTHSDLLYNANVLPQALCIDLQHGTLVSPFSGHFTNSLHGGRRLTFKHKSGLTLQIDLMVSQNISPSMAIKQLVGSGQAVQQGQTVLRLDLQLLQNSDECKAVLSVLPHPAIAAVYSSEYFVEASNDNAFVIQLKNTKI